MNTAAVKRKHGNAHRKPKTLKATKSKTVKVDGKAAQRENAIKSKVRRLNDALESDPVDIDLLRKLMISPDGCVTNDLRCKVWPKLLNVNVFEYPRKKKADIELKEFQENKWWRQVNLDVSRSHRRFPHETRLSRKRVLQHQVTNIIMRVLIRNENLYYYQGYHDIAVTFLRVLGEDLATALLDQLSNTLIRDFMDRNMNRTNRMLSLFYAVLAQEDPMLEKFLINLLYTKGLRSNNICDVLQEKGTSQDVDVKNQLVLTHREQVLERDCDMAMVHHCLSRLPTYIGVDEIENLISHAYDLFKKHPPESLRRDVRRYLKESDSISQHSELLYQSYNQRPDSVLRRRKKLGRFLPADPQQCTANSMALVASKSNQISAHAQDVNPLVKVAVWTMTLSMGVMTFLVLNTSKYWI